MKKDYNKPHTTITTVGSQMFVCGSKVLTVDYNETDYYHPANQGM